jgi:hypothetical protein
VLTTEAASAAIAGDPEEALSYSRRAIAADPRDAWAHYVRAAALARLGKVDDALTWFAAAEERFAPTDAWARSVAMYGSAHALAEAGRCREARDQFLRYAGFVRERDPESAEMAIRYAARCKEPASQATAAAEPTVPNVPSVPAEPPTPVPTPVAPATPAASAAQPVPIAPVTPAAPVAPVVPVEPVSPAAPVERPAPVIPAP